MTPASIPQRSDPHSSDPHSSDPQRSDPQRSDPQSGGPRSNRDRAERLTAVLLRDGDRCVWCGRSFAGLVQPTTDHLVPRVKGGPSWIENEVAACRRCNGQRGHQAPTDWLDECERRGWTPNRAALEAAMLALGTAIDEQGGQRRAAKYLRSQWRRWSRR